MYYFYTQAEPRETAVYCQGNAHFKHPLLNKWMKHTTNRAFTAFYSEAALLLGTVARSTAVLYHIRAQPWFKEPTLVFLCLYFEN